jgi:hypothetical protein
MRDVVPQADDRFVTTVVFEAEHAHTSRAAEEKPASAWRQPKPTGRDHPDDVGAGERQDIALDGAYPGDKAIGPLNERGEERARHLSERLRRFSFAHVFTSPLQRASKTCALAGFGKVAQVDPDLVEWDYGRYEGRLTKDILKERPGWEMFRDGCPEGESPEDVAAR